jgi:hypothetical protein
MSANEERKLARLRAHAYQKAQELADLGFVLRGSILERFSRCGSAGCACHADPPRLHGPYWQWTAKVAGKTVTRNLSDHQVQRYREWMDNAQHLDQIVAELFDLSTQADAVLRELERQAPPAQENQEEQERHKKRRSRNAWRPAHD